MNDNQAFFLSHKLVCNQSKTEVLHLTSRFTQHPPISNITFGQNIIPCVSLLLTYKTVNGYAPSYIEDLVNHYVPSRSLRSTSQGLLTVPRSTTSTYGDRTFSIAAPRLWNTLPLMIRNAQSVSVFKRLLKTYLFQLIYF